MKRNLRWLGWVEFLGAVIIYMGLLIPLEGKTLTDGSLIILMGSMLITLVAYLKMKKNRKGLFIGFVLIFFGVAYLFMLSNYPDFTSTKNGFWWYVPGLTYPLGWLLTILNLSMRIWRKKPNVENTNFGVNSGSGTTVFETNSMTLTLENMHKHAPKKPPKRVSHKEE